MYGEISKMKDDVWDKKTTLTLTWKEFIYLDALLERVLEHFTGDERPDHGLAVLKDRMQIKETKDTYWLIYRKLASKKLRHKL